jgi:UDP-galactopyranose mutase
MNVLIIGSGFSGAVVAERLSLDPQNNILVIDERSHIGGNCYTERDYKTNIMEHKYGPHIFHTSNKFVWDYINSFDEMIPFINRVKSIFEDKVYSLPINLHTINQFFGKNLNPNEANSFINSISDKTIINANNFEEQALKFVGKELYEAFFYGYTKKQWGTEPANLPASILKRLPVRFNYDDNYYFDKFQGIPKNGYTAIFQKMLSKPNIKVNLNTHFDSNFSLNEYDFVVYTGPIDKFFNYKHGRLGYRTVSFEKEYHSGDFQGNAVINYANDKISYTRIHEHKHFTPWETHEETIIFKEFSKETTEFDIPYYPKRLCDDMIKYDNYMKEVNSLSNIYFLGRLATYQYLDMHQIIEEALKLSDLLINKYKKQ